MNVGELKEILKNIPDNVVVHITDLNNFDSNCEPSTFYDGDTYFDLVMPVYIEEFTNDVEQTEEQTRDFTNDFEVMIDFINLSKQEFLNLYNFMNFTSSEYDINRDNYNKNKANILAKLFKFAKSGNNFKYKFKPYFTILTKEKQKLSEKQLNKFLLNLKEV